MGHADFGPAELMYQKANLENGNQVDIVILRSDQINELKQKGLIDPDTIRTVVVAQVGVAVRSRDYQRMRSKNVLSSVEKIRHLFESASVVHVADTKQSTAGKHLANVIDGWNVNVRSHAGG